MTIQQLLAPAVIISSSCEHNLTYGFKIQKKIPEITNQNSKIWEKFERGY